jgi:hypothetical protein
VNGEKNKMELYQQIDKIGGGGSTVWAKISHGSNGTVIAEWNEIGNPESSGFMTFDTLGAAWFYFSLVCEALAAYGNLSGEAWEIEEEFATIAGRFVTHKTEGN